MLLKNSPVTSLRFAHFLVEGNATSEHFVEIGGRAFRGLAVPSGPFSQPTRGARPAYRRGRSSFSWPQPYFRRIE